MLKVEVPLAVEVDHSVGVVIPTDRLGEVKLRTKARLYQVSDPGTLSACRIKANPSSVDFAAVTRADLPL